MMEGRKTCGTCGSGGGRCEWAYSGPGLEPYFRCQVNNIGMLDSSGNECDPHVAYREQLERANKEETLKSWAREDAIAADNRVKELEHILRGIKKVCEMNAGGPLDAIGAVVRSALKVTP